MVWIGLFVEGYNRTILQSSDFQVQSISRRRCGSTEQMKSDRHGILSRTNLQKPFHFAAPKVIIASIYKSLREKMKLLWNRDLKMNTVHVLDVCRAIWHLYLYGQKASVYHLADKSDTSEWTKLPIISLLYVVILRGELVVTRLRKFNDATWRITSLLALFWVFLLDQTFHISLLQTKAW